MRKQIKRLEEPSIRSVKVWNRIWSLVPLDSGKLFSKYIFGTSIGKALDWCTFWHYDLISRFSSIFSKSETGQFELGQIYEGNPMIIKRVYASALFRSPFELGQPLNFRQLRRIYFVPTCTFVPNRVYRTGNFLDSTSSSENKLGQPLDFRQKCRIYSVPTRTTVPNRVYLSLLNNSFSIEL